MAVCGTAGPLADHYLTTTTYLENIRDATCISDAFTHGCMHVGLKQFKINVYQVVVEFNNNGPSQGGDSRMK